MGVESVNSSAKTYSAPVRRCLLASGFLVVDEDFLGAYLDLQIVMLLEEEHQRLRIVGIEGSRQPLAASGLSLDANGTLVVTVELPGHMRQRFTPKHQAALAPRNGAGHLRGLMYLDAAVVCHFY